MTLETAEIPRSAAGHVVHFYDDDAELARTVGDFLAEAARDGGVAVAIADAEHRHAFELELSAARIDVAGAERDGTIILLDAEATLAQFRADGRIDGDAFDGTVGEVMRLAVGRAAPVHAYGEMVSVLWEAGDVLGAIELEKLWNRLQEELTFTLLCAYRHATVSDPEQAAALEQVCCLHTHVVPASQQRTREFPPVPEAAGAARRFVAEALRQWGHSDALVRDAQLVISELATNAVLHTGSRFSVLIRGEDAGVRISVADQSPLPPSLKHPPQEVSSGRGLQVVSALTSRWGVEPAPDGKTVWAHLPA